MRAVLFEELFRSDYFLAACGLNVLYLTLASVYFLYDVHVARVRGLLLQQGE
jgi:ABC-2 type transport system permease protein